MKFRLFTILMFLIAGSLSVSAEEDPIYTSWTNNRAVSGYDTVAYFNEGKAVKGKKEYNTEYMGAEWRFASKANLDAFLTEPAKYAPQYGGYCSWAAARGYTASGDPQQWKIVNGKLYLNYDAKVKAKWEKDIPGFIEAADRIFPTLIEAQ